MSSNLLINESPLQVLPSLALSVGLNEAIILQQVHFWIDKKMKKPEKYADSSFIGGHWWVWNSVPEWQEQFPFWADNTIRRALTTLRQLGVLLCEQLAADKYDKTLYYRIDYEALDKLTAKKPEQKGSRRKKQEKEAKPSPELLNALNSLLGDGADASTQVGQRVDEPTPNVGTSSTQNGQMTSAQNGHNHVTVPGTSLSENSFRDSQKIHQRVAAQPPRISSSTEKRQEKKQPDRPTVMASREALAAADTPFARRYREMQAGKGKGTGDGRDGGGGETGGAVGTAAALKEGGAEE